MLTAIISRDMEGELSRRWEGETGGRGFSMQALLRDLNTECGKCTISEVDAGLVIHAKFRKGRFLNSENRKSCRFLAQQIYPEKILVNDYKPGKGLEETMTVLKQYDSYVRWASMDTTIYDFKSSRLNTL